MPDDLDKVQPTPNRSTVGPTTPPPNPGRTQLEERHGDRDVGEGRKRTETGRLYAQSSPLASVAPPVAPDSVEAPKTPEAPPKPEPEVAVESGGGEPAVAPAIRTAVVPVAPEVAKKIDPSGDSVGSGGGSSQPLCPAPQVVFEEVGATLEALGFPAAGKKLPIRAHTAPVMTATGFSFTDNKIADDGSHTAQSAPVKTGYADGMGKKHATGALAGSDDVTLNPAGDFTTLIHETVHLYQKGEIGRFLVEPMTEIIAAMAFTRLAGQGAVTGSYNYASEYLPWVIFVKEVIAPKIGWPRLFGYYVGQGMQNFDHLAAELGFRPVAQPMKTLKLALSTGDATQAESIRATILDGPGKNDGKRGFDASGPALATDDHDMSSFEAWLPTFGATITSQQKTGETNAQTAQRLSNENKRHVIAGAIAEAREHLKTASPPLKGEIEEFIGAYEEALTMVPV